MDSKKTKISFFIYEKFIIVGYLVDNINKDIKGVSILYDGEIYHRLTTWDGFMLKEIEYDDLIKHLNGFEVDRSDFTISEYKKAKEKIKMIYNIAKTNG